MVGKQLEAVTPPLIKDTDSVIRVGGTRVTLDSIAQAFANGATAEEISLQFPSLKLADVYSTISFILNNPEEVEAYLQERRSLSGKAKSENESRSDPSGIRARLMNRKREA